MTKADLVEQIADATGLTKKDTAVVVDGFLEAVKQALAQEKNIEIRGFGSFKIKKRKARKARNPRTGDPVQVPSRHVPTFKPSKELKELITAMPPVGAGTGPAGGSPPPATRVEGAQRDERAGAASGEEVRSGEARGSGEAPGSSGGGAGAGGGSQEPAGTAPVGESYES